VEKYVAATQATDDNITRRMRCACWISKASVKPHRNANAPQGYVIVHCLSCSVFTPNPSGLSFVRSTWTIWPSTPSCSLPRRSHGFRLEDTLLLFTLQLCLYFQVKRLHIKLRCCIRPPTSLRTPIFVVAIVCWIAGSIPDGVTGIFQWLNPCGRIVALGSTQSLTEISTRNPSWG
jgi:hypothetical protein